MADDIDVNDSVVRDREPETVYTPRDGELVPAFECSLSETSLSCSEDGAFVFSTAGTHWLAYPLPEGKVVDATPFGWWVVQGELAIPADDSAAQYADGPVAMDEFFAIASDRAALWPPGGVLGFEYAFIWTAVAIVGIAVGAFTLWRRSRRTLEN